MKTFPEWIQERATWFDRLRCRVFGHKPFWTEQRGRHYTRNHCYRCGVVL